MKFNVEKAGVKTRRELLRFVRDNFKHVDNTLIVSISDRTKECLVLDPTKDNIIESVRVNTNNDSFDYFENNVRELVEDKNICYIEDEFNGHSFAYYRWVNDHTDYCGGEYRDYALKSNLKYEMQFILERDDALIVFTER